MLFQWLWIYLSNSGIVINYLHLNKYILFKQSLFSIHITKKISITLLSTNIDTLKRFNISVILLQSLKHFKTWL